MRLGAGILPERGHLQGSRATGPNAGILPGTLNISADISNLLSGVREDTDFRAVSKGHIFGPKLSVLRIIAKGAVVL